MMKPIQTIDLARVTGGVQARGKRNSNLQARGTRVAPVAIDATDLANVSGGGFNRSAKARGVGQYGRHGSSF